MQLQGYTTTTLRSAECDLSSLHALDYLNALAPDYVFHLAGKTGIMSSWQQPQEFYQSNVDTTRTLLEFCRNKKISMHYVSGYIYGNQGKGPISEEAPIQPNNPYAHSKWLAEEMCRFYARFFSLPVTISRPFNIYGPLQPLHFFIPHMIYQLRTQEKIHAHAMTSTRDYVYVDDVADALIAIMQSGKAGGCYNIGTGICFSCSEVIELLQQLLGTNKPIYCQETLEAIPHAQANRDKISNEIGWHPKHSLQEGLLECLSTTAL